MWAGHWAICLQRHGPSTFTSSTRRIIKRVAPWYLSFLENFLPCEILNYIHVYIKGSLEDKSRKGEKEKEKDKHLKHSFISNKCKELNNGPSAMHRTMIQALNIEHICTMHPNTLLSTRLQQRKPRDYAWKYAHNRSISDMAAKHRVDFLPHYHSLQTPWTRTHGCQPRWSGWIFLQHWLCWLKD